MAFDAAETLWTPGRVHVGDEVEDEVQAAFDAVDAGAIVEADFSPRAALAPWNFVNGSSGSAPAWTANNTAIDGTGVRLAGDIDLGMLRAAVSGGFVTLRPAVAQGITFQFRSVDESGADTLLVAVAVPAGSVFARTAAAGGTRIGRRGRGYVWCFTPGPAVTPVTVCAALRVRRPWVS